MKTSEAITLVDRDEAGIDRAFRADVLEGLRASRKAIPARWLYDDAGSQLFEDITRVPEYYPTRAETEILTARAAEIAAVERTPKLGFFPGSTIGNMVAWTAVELLRSMRLTLQADHGVQPLLLIGMDLVKDTAVLEAAYDDAGGVTGEFNLNLARRINRELEGTIPIESLRHVARWNDAYARVEMHLEATRDIEFKVSGESFSLAAGETIHTENSHKFTHRSADMLLHAAGWSPRNRWLDGEERFSLILAEATDPRKAP